jgi:hypothetical protein
MISDFTLPPNMFDDDEEFDEAIELSAERAGEIARGLTEVARDFPHIACPKRLVLSSVTDGMLIETEFGVRWIIRRELSEHLALLSALIRPELLNAWTAGSC